jgi:hypothetical protein
MAARIAALGAAALIAAVDALYLYVINQEEGPNDAATVTTFALALATAALLAVAGAFVRDRASRGGLLGTSAALVTVLAVLSGFSVGPLLVPAVVMLLYSMFT